MRSCPAIVLAAGLVVLLAASPASDDPSTSEAAGADGFQTRVRALLTRYCGKCHAGEKPKGDLRLEGLPFELDQPGNRAHWSAVVERLTAGDMPPEGEPRPTDAEI